MPFTATDAGLPVRRTRPAPGPALAAVAVLLPLVVGTPAAAATEGGGAGQGWARVAHLSPDTTTVDVALTAASGGRTVFEVDDVAYGDVSDYWRLPVGSFLIEMTPSNGANDAAPAISELITVTEGRPITLAVLGTNANLTTKVIDDDLTAPADGQARVRVLQASTVADSVDISTTTGVVIASGAAKGEVTGYATVPSGPWDLRLDGGSMTSEADVDLPSGSVTTLLVLDNASGGLTLKAVSDSSSVEETPVGGTNTGASITAVPMTGQAGAGAWGWVGAALLGTALLLVIAAVRRHAPQSVVPSNRT